MTQWEINFDRVLNKLVAKKESEIFRFPVDWKGLNITDYPLIIKRPMDLTTIRDKLEKKVYPSYEEASADVRLIWSNAMLYNASGSKIYQIAKSLSEYFESLWSALYPEDPGRLPTNDEMVSWVDQCHRLNPDDLGALITVIDKDFPNCITKKQETNEVEIHIDLMPGSLFRKIQKVTMEKLPGGGEFFSVRRKATTMPQLTAVSADNVGSSASSKGGSDEVIKKKKEHSGDDQSYHPIKKRPLS